ncbi:conserved protein of unknown function [Thermococcus nautili]|uniref:hypothetical protein n=1 Tax=Thermococcus nautili TaxID=195522 RepID=UPI0025527ED2|nr:hypothetical protein [Thermococcus nautili]CAI1494105.1 conserved protein of unknown function [Thermococcus nautili]
MKLKPEDVEKILKLREDGMKLDEIAAVLGVSRRRVLQVLKTKQIKTPGRKKKELPSEIVNLIVDLKERGHTIEEIHNHLLKTGVKISRYKVWSVIREHRTKQISGEILQTLLEWDAVVGILVLHITLKEQRNRLLLMVDVKNCKILLWKLAESLRLKPIIATIDGVLECLKGKRTLILLSRTPPLVPTRGKDNKLTRHLKNLGVEYQWITSEELIRIQKRLSRRISKEISHENPYEWFKTRGVELVETSCSSYMKRIGMEVGKDGPA